MDTRDKLEDLGVCMYFALCTNDATHLLNAGAIGQVPICDRCQERYDSFTR